MAEPPRSGKHVLYNRVWWGSAGIRTLQASSETKVGTLPPGPCQVTSPNLKEGSNGDYTLQHPVRRGSCASQKELLLGGGVPPQPERVQPEPQLPEHPDSKRNHSPPLIQQQGKDRALIQTVSPYDPFHSKSWPSGSPVTPLPTPELGAHSAPCSCSHNLPAGSREKCADLGANGRLHCLPPAPPQTSHLAFPSLSSPMCTARTPPFFPWQHSSVWLRTGQVV